ncbi:phytanoyl-CoA dioxygenase family protein [Candidatus Pelagibacter ubique]|nr:phytanoyl-CoA dioxygenase family protein [Candidatus Pelagibacter ubique]
MKNIKSKNILKKKYDYNGFVIIRNLLLKDEVEIIKKDLFNYAIKQSKKLTGRHINFTKDGLINSIHAMNDWKWTKKIQNDIRLKDIAQLLLGEKPSNYGAELFAKPAKTGRYVPIHQDNYYWAIKDANALTFWIALDKSSKKNGGLFYYEKSNQLGLLEHVPSYAPGSSQTLKFPKSMKYFKKVLPNLMPGDCLIHNVLTVHGSDKNTSENSRLGWTIRYKSIKSKKDKFHEQKYLRELKILTKNKNNKII